MTDPNTNYENPTPESTESRRQSFAGFDERTGQVVIDAARTGLYAAAGLADAMAGAVKTSYENYQEEARGRRAKRKAQADEVKHFITEAPSRATNLPEQAKEWPDQVRVRTEDFITEARVALIDLAERGKAAVERVRAEGLAGVNRPGEEPKAKADADYAAQATAHADKDGFGVGTADNPAGGSDAFGTPSPEHAAKRAEGADEEGFGIHSEDVSSMPANDDSNTDGDVTDAPGAGFDAPEPQGEEVVDTDENNESHEHKY